MSAATSAIVELGTWEGGFSLYLNAPGRGPEHGLQHL